MFQLEKKFTFEAGHSLVHHDGKCKQPHGHSYGLTVHVRSSELVQSGPKTNMVIDFTEISNIVKPMIEKYLDHHWLNQTLQSESATAEYIAKWIFDHLKPQVPLLYAISIEETASSRVTYSES